MNNSNKQENNTPYLESEKPVLARLWWQEYLYSTLCFLSALGPPISPETNLGLSEGLISSVFIEFLLLTPAALPSFVLTSVLDKF